MFLLTGEYELTLDSKNRLSIPAKVREQVTGEEIGKFYLVLGVNRVLSLYPERYYQRIALAVVPRKATPDESLAFDRVNFALAGRVELDRQGRVLLNEKAMCRAKLGTEVTLIGVGDHLEIWNRDQWEEYLETKMDMHERMLLEAREEQMQLQRELAKEVMQKQKTL